MKRKKLTKRQVKALVRQTATELGMPEWVLHDINQVEDVEVTMSVIEHFIKRTVNFLYCEESDTIPRFCADLRAMITSIETEAQRPSIRDQINQILTD